MQNLKLEALKERFTGSLFEKKSEENLEEYRDITDDVEESDYVPYACLYNPHTLLTKNGELLQTLKVVGFQFEAISKDNIELRETIRRAISSHIPDDNYALWFHTMRRKQSLVSEGSFDSEFARKTDAVWNTMHDWNETYVNELYVTIVRDSQTVTNKSGGFTRGLFASKEVKYRNTYLDESAEQLESVTQSILSTLSSYGAYRLGIVDRNDLPHSENLEFLEKIINLEERPMPLPRQDLSEYLTSGEVTFGFNAMEVRTAEGKRRFASILTLKEYKEASLPAIDGLLRTPCEFIASQCFTFVDAEKAREAYEEQAEILNISGDEDLAEKTELTRILAGNQNRPTDYGQQQTTLFIIAASVKELEASTKMLRDGLAERGIIAIREDLKFEECYWAQLPANFTFVARMSAIQTNHVAGFANLTNYPAGNRAGSPWGAPISLLKTAAGTPYFFNFHHGESGHISVIGPQGSGKSVLANFLVTQTERLLPRIIYLDSRGKGRETVRALGGHYIDAPTKETPNPLSLSPHKLEDTPANREFLTLWLTYLAVSHGHETTQALSNAAKQVIDQFLAIDRNTRTLAIMVETARRIGNSESDTIADALCSPHFPWLTQHADASLPSLLEQISFNRITGINLTDYIDNPNQHHSLYSYLLHIIGTEFTRDKTPLILVLDEGFTLLSTPIFSPRIDGWMQFMATQNAVVMVTSEEIEHISSMPTTPNILQQCTTQIFMPDAHPPMDTYLNIFGLKKEEFHLISSMETKKRHFLLRRGNDTIIGEMNLADAPDIVETLSGMQKDTDLAETQMQDTAILQQTNLYVSQEEV